jgi:hypothetical protein
MNSCTASDKTFPWRIVASDLQEITHSSYRESARERTYILLSMDIPTNLQLISEILSSTHNNSSYGPTGNCCYQWRFYGPFLLLSLVAPIYYS